MDKISNVIKDLDKLAQDLDLIDPRLAMSIDKVSAELNDYQKFVKKELAERGIDSKKEVKDIPNIIDDIAKKWQSQKKAQKQDGTGPHGKGKGPGEGKADCKKNDIDELVRKAEESRIAELNDYQKFVKEELAKREKSDSEDMGEIMKEISKKWKDQKKD